MLYEVPFWYSPTYLKGLNVLNPSIVWFNNPETLNNLLSNAVILLVFVCMLVVLVCMLFELAPTLWFKLLILFQLLSILVSWFLIVSSCSAFLRTAPIASSYVLSIRFLFRLILLFCSSCSCLICAISCPKLSPAFWLT